jgi:hypothetical protein
MISTFVHSYSCFSLWSIRLGLLGRGIGPSQSHYLHSTTQTQNKRRKTSMARVLFEPTTPVFKRAKTVHALNRTATVIGGKYINWCHRTNEDWNNWHFEHNALSPENVKSSELYYFHPFEASQRDKRNCRQTSCAVVSTAVMRHPYWVQYEQLPLAFCQSEHVNFNLKSKSHYDRWSVGQSVLVSSPIWGRRPDFCYCQRTSVLSIWGAHSDERTVLSFVAVIVSSTCHLYLPVFHTFNCQEFVFFLGAYYLQLYTYFQHIFIYNIYKASGSLSLAQ